MTERASDQAMSARQPASARSAEPAASFAKEGRRLEIDRAKGFAIILVVWGHLASVLAIQSPVWFLISITVVYSFHMPLFMYLSGFVYFKGGYQSRFFKDPVGYAKSRADRLLVPFLVFGIIVVFGKFLVGKFAPIADPVNSPIDGLLSVVTNSPGNPSASIWYLLVLFSYTLLAPLIWKVSRRSIVVMLMIGLVAQIPTVTEQFYMDRIFTYFVFFVIGGLVANKMEMSLDLMRRYYIVYLALFVFLCFNFFDHEYGMLICGIASLPAIHGLLLQPIFARDRFLLFIGDNSMAIYLLNTIVMGVCGAILSIYDPGREYGFFPFGYLVVALGVLVPICVRAVMERIDILAPVTRYLK